MDCGRCLSCLRLGVCEDGLCPSIKMQKMQCVFYSHLHSSIIVRKISTPPVAVRNASLP